MHSEVALLYMYTKYIVCVKDTMSFTNLDSL